MKRFLNVWAVRISKAYRALIQFFITLDEKQTYTPKSPPLLIFFCATFLLIGTWFMYYFAVVYLFTVPLGVCENGAYCK